MKSYWKLNWIAVFRRIKSRFIGFVIRPYVSSDVPMDELSVRLFVVIPDPTNGRMQRDDIVPPELSTANIKSVCVK
jgi:hypothetical protein